MTTRRELLTFAALLPLAATPVAGWAQAAPDLGPHWSAWRAAHVTPEGRVVDRWQDNASHSEGQGYGLILAEAVGDRDGFERLLDWSDRNLDIRPDDALRAWRWQPDDGGAGDGPGRVTDMNNASDGDLFHAWALIRAAERFGVPDWTRRAGEIAQAIAERCIRPNPARPGGRIMLPGVEGFEIEGGYVLNPAYWTPRAMTRVGRETGVAELEAAGADAVAELAILSRATLPPDWIALTADGYAPAPEASSNYGYEALRVPLYLVWSGLAGHPAAQAAAAAYRPFLAAGRPDVPTVIERGAGTILETSPDPGYRAIAALGVCSGQDGGTMPAFTADQPYYPATLHLLALVAQRDAGYTCYAP